MYQREGHSQELSYAPKSGQLKKKTILIFPLNYCDFGKIFIDIC
jgi:hypothetical protein